MNLTKSDADRFWSKVSGGSFENCWIWTAYLDWDGYGRFSLGGRSGQARAAHRVAYEHLRAEIPNGLQINHLCRRHDCVNPWHLEPVTVGVSNQRRPVGVPPSHCPQGHPYNPANTYVRPDGARVCRTCARAANRKHYAQNPEKHRARTRAHRERTTP